MTESDYAPLDMDRLHPASREFAERLFTRLPELRWRAGMERRPGTAEWHLRIETEAPSGTKFYVWMENYDEPSFGLGRWHTHAFDDVESMLALMDAVLTDELVALDDPDEPPGWGRLIDPTDRDDLLDALTVPGTNRLRLRSWSGRFDRILDPRDPDALGDEPS